MMKNCNFIILLALFTLISCDNTSNSAGTDEEMALENPSTFKEIGSIALGGAGAAEISAFDEKTRRLYTVNNSVTNQISVIDISNPSQPTLISNIDLSKFNGAANSVAVKDGKLVIALESKSNKQDNGKVLVFDTTTQTLLKELSVGALPDMITFSPNWRYIITANEGEPNDTYTSDPDGSVSIIDVANDYSVTTINFSGFSNQFSSLKTKGFQIASFSNQFVSDIEPEYITVSNDSKTAWVTLQENNGIAKIDLTSKTLLQIFPLGFKDFNLPNNAIDISDKDGGISFGTWKLKGMYQPDAISYFEFNAIPYLVTANEGDAREYSGFVNVRRINHSSVVLDPFLFPNAAALKADNVMGRLNINVKMGDTDGDGDIDELITFGTRSFAIWNGNTGQLVYDSKNELDKRAFELGLYDDNRSDDKGTEPETVHVATMGELNVLFVGLERSDAVMIYDISNPLLPVYLQTLKTGDAPEGLLFIPADKSPTKRSLLVVSSEGDGTIKIYQPNLLEN